MQLRGGGAAQLGHGDYGFRGGYKSPAALTVSENKETCLACGLRKLKREFAGVWPGPIVPAGREVEGEGLGAGVVSGCGRRGWVACGVEGVVVGGGGWGWGGVGGLVGGWVGGWWVGGWVVG